MVIYNRSMQGSLGEKIKQPGRWLRTLGWVLVNGYPARKLRVIGVTGTDGKTTTVSIIYELLKASGKNVGMITTVGMGWVINGKEEKQENALHVTNPDAKIVQKFMRQMADLGAEYIVLEVTSHRLAQLKTLGYNVEIAVLTNLTREHLDYHGTMGNYAAAKARLFVKAKYAVLNKDDEWYEFFAKRCTGKVLAYSQTKLNNISPVLGGDYNKYNIAAAETVADVLGLEKKTVAEVIEKFVGVKGRREEVKNNLGIRMIVDFAHTPNALEKLLVSLRSEMNKNNKLILVFGCTGGRDKGKRPFMGEVAQKYADRVIVTADDPRDEDLGEIYSQIIQKVGGDFLRVDDRDQAIEMGVKMAKKGDVVVATGMGHEETILIKGKEIARSDRKAFEKSILRK